MNGEEELITEGVMITFTSSNTAVGTVAPSSALTCPDGTASVTFTAIGAGIAVVDATNVSASEANVCKNGNATVTVTTPADTTPPASVSNLDETDKGTTWIQWGWTNPADSDFSHTKVYIDGVFKADVNAPGNSYNAAGLSPGTTYTIGTETVDNSGNINTAEVTDTATTSSGADTTPPAPAPVPVLTPSGIIALIGLLCI